MVKKGKGKKKKKSAAALDTAIGDAAAPGSCDELNIEGDGAQLGIGKKKKPKKKKLTKEEKQAAKLAKKLSSFQEDEVKYTNFWHKMDKWMKDNAERVEEIFKHQENEEEGYVLQSYFKAGLRDLECPVTDLELFCLIKILDPEDSGMVHYTNFQAGMRQPLPLPDSDGEEKDLRPDDFKPGVISVREKLPFNCVGDPYLAKYPRYIYLGMKLKDFLSIEKHPGHFQLIVLSHLTVRGLITKIGELSEITSGQLRVYAGKECIQEECLHPRLTLEECGFEGGPQWAPQKGILYYDYFVEYDDCPLLNCDYYFGNTKKPANPVLKAAFPDYEERLMKNHRKSVDVVDS